MNPIKRARVLAELTQTELAAKVGVTPGAVSQWETGRFSPSGRKLKRLSVVLGVTVDELLSDEGRAG